MPAGPGDACLTTVFADIHYYFASPATKPAHDRFSRGSYFYVYHNAVENTAKLEIANHAGTPDQDAFSGSMSNIARLSYSYKQPSLFTLTIDGASIQGHDQWHIPSYNERNEQKYLYKIHTLDVYLWTESDAATLLKYLQALLPIETLDIRDAPASGQSAAEHRDSMSPVVQQLEKTAVGTNFPPRSASTISAQSLPGPPTPATSVGGASTASPQPAQVPTPMAYNPAAPAAPEQRIYREKTPPPLDDGSGTALSNAARYDAVPQQSYQNVPNTFHSSNQTTPQAAYFSGPPQPQLGRNPSATGFPGPPQISIPPQRTQSGNLPPPPPPPGTAASPQQQQAYHTSFSGPPAQQQPSSPPPSQASFNRQSTQFGGAVGQTQYAQYNPAQAQRTPSFGPGAIASPGLGMPGGPPTPSAPPAYQSPGIPPPPSQLQLQPAQPQTQAQAHAQVFGYSNYSYSATQNPQGYNPSAAYGYAGQVHDQLYRPTEAETTAHGRPQTQRVNSEQRTKLEGKVRDVEGKVGGYLKRLDKLW